MAPDGEIVIKHWKNNNNAWVFPYTTPSDIYGEFVERFGREALFPVARTPLGGIGLITCGELGFPENARCTMMNGAEVLLHLTSEPHNMSHGDVRNWEALRTARAYENKCYLAMANIGMYEGATRGLHGSHGDSAVHSFDGSVLNKVNGGGEATIKGPIDLEALRRARAKPFHPGHPAGRDVRRRVRLLARLAQRPFRRRPHRKRRANPGGVRRNRARAPPPPNRPSPPVLARLFLGRFVRYWSPMKDGVSTGVQIRRLKEQTGFSAAELAEAAGLGVNVVREIESGNRDFEAKEVFAIAEFLGVSPLAIFEPDSLLGRLPVAPSPNGDGSSCAKVRRLLTSLAEFHHVLSLNGHHASIPSAVGKAPRRESSSTWLNHANDLADWTVDQLGIANNGNIRLSDLAAAIERRMGIDVMVEANGSAVSASGSTPADAQKVRVETQRRIPVVVLWPAAGSPPCPGDQVSVDDQVQAGAVCAGRQPVCPPAAGAWRWAPDPHGSNGCWTGAVGLSVQTPSAFSVSDAVQAGSQPRNLVRTKWPSATAP